MHCPECNNIIADGSTTCPECGSSIDNHNSDAAETDLAKPKSHSDLSEGYACETCGEELEYITTYKQWYCYTCQTYADLPPPKESSELELELDDELDSIEEEFELEGVELTDSDEFTADDKDPTAGRDIDYKHDVDEEFDFEIDETDESEESEDSEESEEVLTDITGDDAGEEVLVVDEDGDEIFIEDDDILEPELEEIPDESESIEADSELDESITIDFEDVEFEEDEEHSIELGESNIEEIVDPEIEIEFYEEESNNNGYVPVLDEEIVLKETDSEETILKKKALAKLHQAWVRVSNLRSMYPTDSRILELESELKETFKSDFDAMDGIILAEESTEEAAKLEKEFSENLHSEVDNIYHFVYSKIILGKKAGFGVFDLENELDEISSQIARGEYLRAKKGLETCLAKIQGLPNAQKDVMANLDPGSELMMDLLEPLPKPKQKVGPTLNSNTLAQ
jgi:hypothetical protein